MMIVIVKDMVIIILVIDNHIYNIVAYKSIILFANYYHFLQLFILLF